MFDTSPSVILSTEQKPIEGIYVPADQLYKHLKEVFAAKNLPNLATSLISLSEGGVTSHNREYLRVSRKDLVFDICTAPFGVHSFISWRLGEKTGFFRKLLCNLPLVGRLFAKVPKKETYYESDANYMFVYSINQTLNEVVEDIRLNKGIRGRVELKSSVMHTEN